MSACKVGMSRHAHATRGVEEALLATRGAQDPPALVLLFVTHEHGDPDRLLATARATVPDAPIVGCVSSGVLSDAGEVENGPCVVAMAIAGNQGDGGGVRSVHTFRVSADGESTAPEARQLADRLGRDATRLQIDYEGTPPATLPRHHGVALVFPDAYSAPPRALVDAVAEALPGTPIVGSLVTGPRGLGPAIRWHADSVTTHGAVGAVLTFDAPATIGVAHGCAPVGPVYTVTRAHDRVIAELDKQPAFSAFAEHARPLLDDLERAAQSVFLVEAAPPPGSARPASDPVEDDFLVRGFLKFDPDEGLLAVSEPIAEGTRVRFAVRNPLLARERLRRMAQQVKHTLGERSPRWGLYLNCAGRGEAFFGAPDHDVAFLQHALGRFPLAGCFGGGEIAPVRGRPELSLFAGVLVAVP